jgi:hypothetical protein
MAKNLMIYKGVDPLLGRLKSSCNLISGFFNF